MRETTVPSRGSCRGAPGCGGRAAGRRAGWLLAAIAVLATSASPSLGTQNARVALPAATAAMGEMVAPVAEPVLVERQVVAMGTRLRLLVEAPSRPRGLAASELAVRAIAATEARLSTWTPTSELAALQGPRSGGPQPLSAELAVDLLAALRCAAETAGAFDPTVGPLVAAWDLRGAGRVPDRASREQALARVGWRHLRLAGGVIDGLSPGLIEEGGFGKGAGLDAAVAALRAAGTERALIDFGGQLAALDRVDGPGFVAEIADPRERTRPRLRLAEVRGSLATSSNGERGLLAADGRTRIGHLLDPATGEPVPDPGFGVTVEAAGALRADCLATALFVVAGRGGPAAALALATELGVEVVILMPAAQAEARVAHATVGICRRLAPLDAVTELRCAEPAARPRQAGGVVANG